MSSSTKVLSLRCSNCGASLKISAEQEYFACGYCGTEQIVERSGGTVYLKPIIDAIRKVQVGTDKTASEMALKRLEVELSNINNDIAHLEKEGQDPTKLRSRLVPRRC